MRVRLELDRARANHLMMQHLTPPSTGITDGEAIVDHRLPTDMPPFTKADLEAAIPAHCFERSTIRSLAYTAKDLAIAALLYWLSTFIDHPSVPSFAPYVLWPAYWICQGCICTGLWVIAHECGHRAFSDNIVFGDAVGITLHSLLLVPYHSWRISHGKHHRSTNDMERDEVFIPATRSEMGDIPGLLSGPQRVLNITRMLIFGWPSYLLVHTTGRKYGSRTNHYEPSSPLFLPNQYWLIVASDAALFAVTYGLLALGYFYGALWLVKVYLVPYLMVNAWLVLITNLQHTDLSLPHYRGEEWSWLKGALCTIDRDYGILNNIFHNISDTHVVHHLFSQMPHYNAMEATKAVIPVLGKYYVRDTVSPGLRGVAEALWTTTQYCQFVEDAGSVLWFKFK